VSDLATDSSRGAKVLASTGTHLLALSEQLKKLLKQYQF
jgi:hypothetical protein